MKLVTFQPPAVANHNHSARLGLLADRSVVDLQHAARLLTGDEHPAFASMQALLEGGAAMMDRAGEIQQQLAAGKLSDEVRLDRADVRFLSPLPRPASLRDCLAYERHLQQATSTAIRHKSRLLAALDRTMLRWFRRPLIPIPRVWYRQPLYYKGNPSSVVGPDTEIHWPPYTDLLDFELELAIVIMKHGCNIRPEEVEPYIAGYTIFNDFSARDIQLQEMRGRLGPAKGKDFDTGNVLGPALVTVDEIGMTPDLRTEVKVNDQIWSVSRTGDMQFSIAEIVAWISASESLFPGDVIGLGTVPNGCGLELDRWIQPGDVVELTIDGVGTLRNRIGPRPDGRYEGDTVSS